MLPAEKHRRISKSRSSYSQLCYEDFWKSLKKKFLSVPPVGLHAKMNDTAENHKAVCMVTVFCSCVMDDANNQCFSKAKTFSTKAK